jgi:MFS family permease
MKRSERQWLILGAMVFALFMVMLDMTVITVALPSIGRSLNASEQALEWTVNAFSLALASLTLLGGKLGTGSAGVGSSCSGWRSSL